MYLAYQFRLAITKDIALAEADLRLRKPHWSASMVKKRARQKYAHELKMIGAAWLIFYRNTEKYLAHFYCA